MDVFSDMNIDGFSDKSNISHRMIWKVVVTLGHNTIYYNICLRHTFL